MKILNRIQEEFVEFDEHLLVQCLFISERIEYRILNVTNVYNFQDVLYDTLTSSTHEWLCFQMRSTCLLIRTTSCLNMHQRIGGLPTLM